MSTNKTELPQKFNAGLIQIAFEKDVNHNIKKACEWVNNAAKSGAQVICLPELFRTQYFCQTEDIDNFNLAETIPGPSTEALGKIAKQNKVVIIVPVFEKRAQGIYHNTVVILDTEWKYCGTLQKDAHS